MYRSEKSVWLTMIVVELIFIVLTRVVLSRYWTYSLDAELIRTPLRLLAVLAYWYFLREFIKSEHVTNRNLLQPALLFPLVLFLSVPILVGDLSYMTPMTRVVYALTSIVVALKEEITFRALIQKLLAKRFGNLKAILITTLVFTAYHIGAVPLLLFPYGQVVIAGLVLGIVYARTQNLLLVVWIHTLYDALWSLTPVFSPPFPYSIGIAVLSISLLLILKWGWTTITEKPRLEF